jgi:tetratricopeptide (TPR) repeat protein
LKKTRLRAAGYTGALVFNLLLGGVAAYAAGESIVLRLRAAELAHGGRCQESVEVARGASALDPEDAELARLEGLCLAQLGRYEEALPALERATRLEPGLPGVALRLGVVNFQLEHYDDAARAFAFANSEDPDNTELLFYRGLLALRDDAGESAAVLLEQAMARSPNSIGAAGSYYAGLAWERAQDDERARQALRDAIDVDPNPPWAERARDALGRIQARSTLRRWGTLTAGMEYDSNAVLRGNGVELPNEISGDSDWRGVWRLEAGQMLWANGDWSTGVIAGYQGFVYVDLDDFDFHYPSVSLWLDRRINKNTRLRLIPNFGYGWRDQDDYISTYGLSAGIHHRYQHIGSGRFFIRFDRDNLLFNVREDGIPPFDDQKQRNRDGNRWTFGYDHRYALGTKTVFRGGFAHERYDARGREYSFDGYQPWLGVSHDLFGRVVMHARGSYQRRIYRHPSTYQDPPFVVPPDLSRRSRKENDFGTELALERRFGDTVSGSLRWRYRDNGSNRDVYDYDRHRIGAFVTIAWSK